MKLDEIPDTNVDTMVTDMELRMKKAFDDIHPETTKKVTIRKNNTWFNDRIKEQKRIVWCRERECVGNMASTSSGVHTSMNTKN